MLQSATPASFSLRTRLSRPELQAGRRSSLQNNTINDNNDAGTNMDDLHDLGSDDEGGDSKGRSKSRRELPAGAVATLKAWLLSPEHFTHPYPTPQDQAMLMQKTGIDKKQLKNWFTNARRRIWKPMLKKQIEQGKLTTTSGGIMPGLLVPPPMENPHSVQAVRTHYQQAVAQNQPPQVTVDAYGNQVYMQQPSHQQPPPPPPLELQYYQQQPSADSPVGAPSPIAMRNSTSIGSLPPMISTGGGGGQLNKTDSHAVLMELFARDQDLVRQATESARMKAAAKAQNPNDQQQQQQLGGPSQQGGGGVSSQHPMKTPSQSRMSVPSLNSWPHFSSISSLNNLGTMPGVKSITSMSGVDLANQGNFNKMGNLAQVKSMESMGKNDSYAFLEVFFGDRSLNSMANLAAAGSKGTDTNAKGKRDRDDDNDVGLSLDDEGPSTTTPSLKTDMTSQEPAPSKDPGNDTGTLKRAYDDALAARGLMSVSRSSEKLTDLALPAKIQRTLSQEFMRQSNPQTQSTQVFGQYYSTSSSPGPPDFASQQYPGQHPGEPSQFDSRGSSYMSDPSETNASVEVPAATKCALCQRTNVDTQLRPCGHFYHESCLKPSLQTPAGPPRCPVDHIEMQSALLAVPTENAPQPPDQSKSWNAPAVESHSGNSSN